MKGAVLEGHSRAGLMIAKLAFIRNWSLFIKRSTKTYLFGIFLNYAPYFLIILNFTPFLLQNRPWLALGGAHTNKAGHLKGRDHAATQTER